jgi:LSD1 subclass zinc finger protein
VIVQCRHCGAPLDVSKRSRKVKCAYCGTVNVVGETRHLQAETPRNWAPPQTWTPPTGAAPLPYRPPSAGAKVAIWLLVIFGLVASSFAGLGIFTAQMGAPLIGPTLLSEWHSESCMVDANGDGVLDAVGLLGHPASDKIPMAVVDGRNGDVLWQGGDYNLYTKVLCLGPNAVALDRQDFNVDFRPAKDPDRLVKVRVPDRTAEYGVGNGCVELATQAGVVTALSFEGKAVASCTTARRPVWNAAGYQAPVTSSSDIWYQTIGGVTYVLVEEHVGTPFITATAVRGVLPAPEPGESMNASAFRKALPTLPTLWTVKLPFSSESDGCPGIVIGKRLVTWGIDPAHDDAGGVLIGLDIASGSLTYAKTQGSPTWSKKLRELHTDGTHIVALWGFGIFAYDPTTGERVWHIGGR